MQFLYTLLNRPHVMSASARGAVGACAGAILFGGMRAILHYSGYLDAFYDRFSRQSFESLFQSTWHAGFPDLAVLPGALAAALVVLLGAQVWKIISELP